jgi:hypothetical protein
MSRALDPSMPKGFRQLGLRQISQLLGIDPRGDRAKDIINTISGLDPQSLEGIRRGIVQSTNDAEPGQIAEMTRGILTGQVPPDQLMDLARSAMQPPAPPGGEADNGSPMMLGGPGTNPALAGADTAPVDIGTDVGAPPALLAQAPPGTTVGPRSTQPATMPPEAAPTTDVPAVDEARVPARMREIPPELASALGLDLDNRYRVIDVMKAGWNRIPSDAIGMRKLSTEIGTAQNGVVDTMSMASQLAALVKGNPEALDATLRIPIPGGGMFNLGVNPSSLGSKIGSFMEGILNVVGISPRQAGGEGTASDLGRWAQDTASDPKNSAFIARQTAKIVNWVQQTGGRIEDTAELNARINSIMVPLAFAMAAAKGQTGRFLSDRDVAFQLQELGESNNPAQFVAAISDMMGRLGMQYETKMRALTGGTVPLTNLATPEVTDVIQRSGIAPASVLRLVGIDPASVAPSSVGPERPGPVSPDSQGTNFPDLYLNRPIGKTGNPSAPPGATGPQVGGPTREVPGRRSYPRVSPTIEQEESAAIGRLQEDRAAALEQRTQGRRRLELAESAEARAARNELEQRRLHIQAAFANIGKALSGSISGGGGGISAGGGGDQDPNAFRITPSPQRRAPTPVSAAPYQNIAPRRR